MPYTLTPFSLGADTVSSGFRIRRTLATTQGQQSAADKSVAAVLTELDGILRKKFVPQGDKAADALKRIAVAKLAPRRADRDGDEAWPKNSAVALVRAEVSASTERTIAGAIAAMADVSDLRFELDSDLDERWSLLDPSVRIVLGYTAIRDFLFARAVFVHGLRQPTSLLSYVLTDAGGVGEAIDYAVVSAARKVALDEAIAAPELTKDTGAIVAALSAADIPLTEGGFRPLALQIVRGELDAGKFDDIIAASGIASIPSYLKPRLVTLLKQSPVQPTTENAPFLVQLYLEKAAASSSAPEAASSLDPFAVEFYGDDAATDAVNTAAVRCAAQLYYVMTLGDELGVFDAVRFFTDSYLFHDGLAITDPVLRKDLEDYVFSNRFPVIDPSTGLTDKVDVTREPMRRAYYRQVFNSGDAPTAGDAPVNEEFGRLWKILILESARYLERAQISPNPDNFVSRQNVMQAVEDLQYNLSTNCVGLATVMTPMMNAELDFVVKRILGHPEIRQHVAPSGGSWLKVIDRLAAARGTRARTSVLNNKARLGYTLITSIAGYTPWAFEQDAAFSEFISTVDAFITTQSILQESTSDDDAADAGSSGSSGIPSGLPGMPSGLPGMPSGLPGMPSSLPGMPGLGGPGSSGAPSAPPSGSDDWDF